MQIIAVASGLKKTVIVKEAETEDFKSLIKKRYAFAWKSFKSTTRVYKLQIKGQEDILGVMALLDVPGDKRIEIKLLAASIENIGEKKVYDRIAGCLIAFACRLAVVKYGTEACVSLVPKTELSRHYMEKYYMQNAGWQLYIEGRELNKLLKEYFYEY